MAWRRHHQNLRLDRGARGHRLRDSQPDLRAPGLLGRYPLIGLLLILLGGSLGAVALNSRVPAALAALALLGVFVVFFMRYEARERWSLVIPYAVVLVFFIWFAFDYFMAVPWPPTFIGQWFPLLKAIPSV